jgi:crossover junction endodeoxyribonuclease RuvC
VIVLGVDPGTIRTGWGVVERDGHRLRGVSAGVLNLGASRPLEHRLKILFDGLVEVLGTARPDVVAVEDIFYAKYANAALKLGHARGVALLVAANAGLAVHTYPPAVVKRTVAGRGAADKEQVARLVGAMLGWKVLPSIDATDALAIAITHAQSIGLEPLRAAGRSRPRRARSRS